jgi:sarcosine oxidase
MKRIDVVVIGLGIMGSAAAWQLSRSGAAVLGIEAGSPTHDMGSSHGASRIFRRAYWEGSGYLPLLNLAHEGWMVLQAATERQLIFPGGGVFIGPGSRDVVAGSLRTAIEGGIPHAHWNAAEIRQHVPQFVLPDQMHAIYEPGAYAIAAEQARLQMLDESVRGGARLWHGERVRRLESTGKDVCIQLDSGTRVRASAAIVTAGPWMARQLLPELSPWLKPSRIPVYWFHPRPGQENSFRHGQFPLFLYHADDDALLYGIPSGVAGEEPVKIGFHNRQKTPADPDALSTAPVPQALQDEIGSRVAAVLPGLQPVPCRSKWCWYTMSPDESFLLAESERHSRVFFASACSGHGFKFAPAIGRILAAMALQQPLPLNIDSYSPRRLV